VPAALDPLAREILDTYRDAYVCMDASGVVVEWNASAERLLGWTREEAVGSELADLVVPPALRTAHRSELLRYLSTGASPMMDRSIEVALQHRDGREIPVDFALSALRARSELYFNAVVRDLRPDLRREKAPTERLRAVPVAPPDAELAEAIERILAGEQDLRIVVQPIVDLARGVICGYEALSRFTGPPDATPDRWFDAAGRLGRSGALEARAIESALARRGELPPNCFLSLNVSPHALEAPEVRDVFAQAGALGGIVVELTEQSVVSDYDELLARLEPLRDAGAMIAVDDAGAGYASLRHVLAIRPDLVKLDRSLADGVDRDPAKAAVVEMLGGLAGRLDAWLLAEGIEREAELETLVALGVPLAQGYLLARPGDEFALGLPAPITARLRERRATPAAGLVAELVEPVATIAETDTDLLLPEGEHVGVVVDGHGRPVALVRRGPLGVLRGLGAVMTVLPQDPLRDVALRAMAREEAERYEPVVCHDEVGRLVGIVRLERLVAHLAAAS
jgi:PAS domain S-box-containing protein